MLPERGALTVATGFAFTVGFWILERAFPASLAFRSAASCDDTDIGICGKNSAVAILQRVSVSTVLTAVAAIN